MSLTIAQAAEKMRRLGIPVTLTSARPVAARPARVPSARQSFDFSDLEKAHEARIAQLKREHEDAIAKIERDADKTIAYTAKHRELLKAESALHRRLLREQQIVKRRAEDRVQLTHQSGFRQFMQDIGGTLSEYDKRQWDDELSGAFDDTGNPAVQAIARFLRDVWRREAIDVLDCVDPRIANGSAVRKLRQIQIGPIQNLRIASIALHETGHIVHPDVPDRREVLAEDRYHKISVPCELAAWTWVLAETPYWDQRMHDDMTRFLGSYKHYAIDVEKVAIDQLCSPASFLATTHRINTH
jgi:hypothetical protein